MLQWRDTKQESVFSNEYFRVESLRSLHLCYFFYLVLKRLTYKRNEIQKAEVNVEVKIVCLLDFRFTLVTAVSSSREKYLKFVKVLETVEISKASVVVQVHCLIFNSEL